MLLIADEFISTQLYLVTFKIVQLFAWITHPWQKIAPKVYDECEIVNTPVIPVVVPSIVQNVIARVLGWPSFCFLLMLE